MRIAGTRSIEIHAGADQLWWLVADVTRMGEWSPTTTRAVWVPPADGPTAGARFRGTNRLPIVRRWTSTATVVKCEPGRAFSFVVGRDPADPNTTWSYTFTSTARATTVTEQWEMIREPTIVLAYYRLIGQARRVASGVEETLTRLKTFAEQPGTSRSTE